MGITEVTVPKQYVLVQNAEPSAQFQGQIWYKPDTANTYIYQANEWKLITIDPTDALGDIEDEIINHELNIIELRAVTESTPIDANSLLSDTVLKSGDGARNSINTSETNATFIPNNGYVRNAVFPVSNVVAYWRFEETTGTTAIDYKGNNDGTINGATINQDGKVGKAYSFNGTNNYVALPNSAVYNFTDENSFSITAWINTATISAGTSGIYIQHSLGQNQHTILFIRNGDKIGFRTEKDWVGVSVDITGTTELEINTWYFVAVTYNGTTAKIYINCEEDASGNKSQSSCVASTATPNIGRNNRFNNEFWNGKIDEVGIFNKTLSVDELKEIFNNSSGFPYLEEDDEEEKEVNINLPTINGDVTHTQLIINGEIEKDASIKYVLINEDAEETSDLILNTKNALTIPKNPTKMIIKLTPKETDPTISNPSIKSYCLKIWKSGGE